MEMILETGEQHVSVSLGSDFLKNIYKHFLKNKIVNETNFYQFFCYHKKEHIFLDYSVIKDIDFSKPDNEPLLDALLHYMLTEFTTTMVEYGSFYVHLNLKTMKNKDIDKYYGFISKSCEMFKTRFPDKLNTCFIYNTPFLFTSLYSIFSALINKETRKKIVIYKYDNK
jgi:hypothetical protein